MPRHNLSVLLARVHELAAVSRSQLTKETGLNRSTVGALVAELVDLGLVVETEPDPTRLVGRPSAVIVPSRQVVAIAVNPELDEVEVALVALGGVVLARSRRPTGSTPTVQAAVALAVQQIHELLAAPGAVYRVAGVGLAVPGLVRADDGVVALAPDLDWRDAPIAALIGEATGLTSLAANDATLGAIAEHVRGAGRGHDDVIYVNGGASGIGGGIIVGGTVLGGVSGFAGELGHTLVNNGGVLCHCGSTGCLETEVRRDTLLEALKLDTAQAKRVIESQRGYLARALANTVNLFNPKLIVLGGFLATLLETDPARLKELVSASALRGPRDDVQLSSAELGGDTLMIGAAELVFAKLIADPAGTALASNTTLASNTELASNPPLASNTALAESKV